MCDRHGDDEAQEQDDLLSKSLFEEPADFRPATPPPTTIEVRLDHLDKSLSLTLVGNHPLWGHHLWNAARVLVDYIQQHPEVVRGMNVLELGAGAGLPGIVCALLGAKHVVLTDYPDAALIENLIKNVSKNCPNASVDVKGLLWGKNFSSLLEENSQSFDLVILSDLIFNHSQHRALLKTCEEALGPQRHVKQGCLVFYTSHRPHLQHKDLAFFALAEGAGWHAENIIEAKPGVMFEEDAGSIEIRSTVHGYFMTRT